MATANKACTLTRTVPWTALGLYSKGPRQKAKRKRSAQLSKFRQHRVRDHVAYSLLNRNFDLTDI